MRQLEPRASATTRTVGNIYEYRPLRPVWQCRSVGEHQAELVQTSFLLTRYGATQDGRKKRSLPTEHCHKLRFNHPTQNVRPGNHTDQLSLADDWHADNVMRCHLGDDCVKRLLFLNADRWSSHDLFGF